MKCTNMSKESFNFITDIKAQKKHLKIKKNTVKRKKRLTPNFSSSEEALGQESQPKMKNKS